MGGKTSTSTQQVAIPPAVLAQYQSVNQQAANTAATPFQTYNSTGTAVAPDYSTGNTGTFVAPVNSEQTTGIANTNTAANEAQPYYDAATGVLGATQNATTGVNNAAEAQTAANSNGLSGAQINQYLSPYLGDVLSSTEALTAQQNEQAQSGALGTAISSGAFGGDRTGLAAANLQQQEDLAAGNVYSGIANTGYQSALSTAQGEQQLGLSGAQQLANIGSTAYGEGANTSSALAGLGTGAQSAALQGANAQIAAGTVEQQTQQAQDTAEYNQFEQEQSYPFQVDQFLANIAEGTGALSGSTTTTTQPGGFFSDKRLKHDIKKVGKTYDGQDIYSYKMAGDPRTHIGLIAQQVEKKHPEAVGLRAGFKTVDYGKATDKAASRGHFDSGGLVARRAYAGGGPSIVDAADLSAILAAQQSMYAPYSGGAGLYGSTSSLPHGGTARVPAPTGSTPHLVTASGGLKPPPSVQQNTSSVVDLATKGAKLYHNIENDAPSDDSTTPASSWRGGLRVHKDSGGYLDDVLNAQEQMYANKNGQQRDIPSQTQQHQLAVANGSPQPAASGSSELSQSLGDINQGYQIYNRFTKKPPSNNTPQPDSSPTSTPPDTMTSPGNVGMQDVASPAPDTSYLDADAPALESSAAPEAADTAATVAAPAAEDAVVTAGGDAAGTALAGAGEGALMAGGTDAAVVGGSDAAAILAAEEAAPIIAGAIAAKRGGLMRPKYDAGGMPYSTAAAGTPYSSDGSGVNIPDDENTSKLQTAGALQKIPTGFQDMISMGNPNNTGTMVGDMFSNEAVARGGLVARRKYATDGSVDDDSDPDVDQVINPQGVGRGQINRTGNGLLYARDASSAMPYAEQDLAPNPNTDMGGKRFGLTAGDWSNDSTQDTGLRAIDVPASERPNLSQQQPTGLSARASSAPTASSDRPLTMPQPDFERAPSVDAGSVPDVNKPAPTWWDKIKNSSMRKPENLIPLLSAIGAMGTAPTKHLGVALAAGLQGGANAYFPAQEAAANVQQTQATTGNIGARTQGQQIQNLKVLQDQYALKGMALYPDPNGPIRGPDGTRYVARPKTASLATSQPTTQPTQYNYLGDNGVQRAQDEGVRYSMLPDETQGESQKKITEVYDAGNLAQSRLPTIQRWEQSLAANPTGSPLAPGAFSELRNNAANMWNTTMDQFGHPEFKVSGLDDALMAQKMSGGAAALQEAENQQRSIAALQAFMKMTPNTTMPREAALQLIADMHMENEQSIDKKNYLDEFDNATQRNYGPVPRNYLATDALQAFDRDHPATNYEGERNSLASILQSQGFGKLSNDLANKPEQIKRKYYEALDKKYGKNFHRYFTGS
jgi:hypothetical protein